MLIKTHLMSARLGLPNVDNVGTLKHFFPCLDQSQFIDTKGGVIYTPEVVSYDTTLNTFKGTDDYDERRALTSGAWTDFGTDSFGALVVGVIDDTATNRAVTLAVGQRDADGDLKPGIVMSADTSDGLYSGGFNTVSDSDSDDPAKGYHYTARILNAVTDGNTYLFQVTCDRENNVLIYRRVDITSAHFSSYTDVSVLPFQDGNVTGGTTLNSPGTDLSAFVNPNTGYVRTYDGSTFRAIESGVIQSSTASTVVFTSLTTDASIEESNITDGVTARIRYPDYGNEGSLSEAGPLQRSVANAPAVTPSAYCKLNNMKMYGAAYFSFPNGVPSDWDYGCSWMAWAWQQGYRVPYPPAADWT